MSKDQLLESVLAGDRRSIAKMISIVEAGTEFGFDQHHDSIAQIFKHAGKAHIIGLTGVPGSGKSTLVAMLTKEFRKSGKKVGIIAIDPSSPFSGGAILGDRIRMSDLSGDPGVFIRSMATRGALGGLARASLSAADVLDAAGFDIVMIETVGVGQDEVDIASAAHSVVVVSAPGLGDDIQAIKAGVLEIADIHIVSKCDRPDADRTVADLKGMISLGTTGKDRHGWNVPVIATSAETGLGIGVLAETLGEHRIHLFSSGEMASRLRDNLKMRILKTATHILLDKINNQQTERLDQLLERTSAREIDPDTAARKLLSDS